MNSAAEMQDQFRRAVMFAVQRRWLRAHSFWCSAPRPFGICGHLFAAEAHIEVGAHERAAALLDRLAQAWQAIPFAAVLRARIAELAAPSAAVALQSASASPDERLAGRRLIDRGRRLEAIDFWQNLQAGGRHTDECVLRLASLNYQLGEWEEAEKLALRGRAGRYADRLDELRAKAAQAAAAAPAPPNHRYVRWIVAASADAGEAFAQRVALAVDWAGASGDWTGFTRLVGTSAKAGRADVLETCGADEIRHLEDAIGAGQLNTLRLPEIDILGRSLIRIGRYGVMESLYSAIQNRARDATTA